MATQVNVFQRNNFFVNTKTIVRREKLEGKERIVAPMSMITEGVHAGSGGPVFYPGQELEKSGPTFNHKPVVVYHPKKNGSPVSACSPEILEDYKVGLILNTDWTKLTSKLKAEAWNDEDRLEVIDSRVLEALNNGDTMEVSTGMFMDLEETPGVWNGERYYAIARNIRGDHLAILPDIEGACSRKDGAGLLVNTSLDKFYIERQDAGFLKALEAQGLTVNDLSFSTIRQMLQDGLREKMGKPGIEWYGFIDEVFQDFVVFYAGGKYYKVDYTVSKNSVKISGDPVEVQRVISYQTTSGTLIGNMSPDISNPSIKENDMDKKQKVAHLIANSNGVFTDKDQDFLLNSKTDQQLDQLIALNKPAPTPAPAGTIPVTAQVPVVNETETVESYIAKAPPGMREMFTNMWNDQQAAKEQLVTNIMAAPGNRFTKEFLMLKPVSELQGISSLIQKPVTTNAAYPQNVPMFQGNAPTPQGGSIPTINEKPMPIRSIYDAPPSATKN